MTTLRVKMSEFLNGLDLKTAVGTTHVRVEHVGPKPLKKLESVKDEKEIKTKTDNFRQSEIVR